MPNGEIVITALQDRSWLIASRSADGRALRYPRNPSVPTPTLAAVSIVIPAFNVESTISRNLDAASNQTVPSHWISVVDYASNDCASRLVDDPARGRLGPERAGFRAGRRSRLRAGISLRCMHPSAASFRGYTERFDQTYCSHRMDRWYLDARRLILRGLCRPLQLIRSQVLSRSPLVAEAAVAA